MKALLSLVLLAPAVAAAQPAPVDSIFASATDTIAVPLEVSLPADTLDMGRLFDARVRIAHRGLEHVQLLVGDGGLEPLEVVEVRRELDTGDTVNVSLRLRAFAVGDVVAPPVVMAALTPDGAMAVGVSDSLRVRVASIVPDEAEELRDIHEAIPIEPPFPWWLVVVGLAVLAGVIAFVLWLRRRRNRQAARAGVRARPADQLALEALAALDGTDLFRGGPWKTYYTRVTEVLRTYLVRRFGIDAPDMTTTEILRSIQELDLSTDAVMALRNVLLQADQVKFARVRPTPEDPRRHLDAAAAFVRLTRPRPEPEAVAEPVGAAR